VGSATATTLLTGAARWKSLSGKSQECRTTRTSEQSLLHPVTISINYIYMH
jgi:hypothetical protein